MAFDPASFNEIFLPLQAANLLFSHRPLLAHYTSISNIEAILRKEEIRLSNPLFMNDLSELRTGMWEGRRQITDPDNFGRFEEAVETADRAKLVVKTFEDRFSAFDSIHALDLYLFCLSEHSPSDNDGRLSMWRAYGAAGNGAALVINTDFVQLDNTSPLLFSKVIYKTFGEQQELIRGLITNWCAVAKSLRLNDDDLKRATILLFNCLQLFALIVKHPGFNEEAEWRIIYMRERDSLNLLTNCLDHSIGRLGVEPKLRLPIRPLPIAPPTQTWTMESIFDRIILGPAISSYLAKISFCRMLENIGRSSLVSKVVASTIPLRP